MTFGRHDRTLDCPGAYPLAHPRWYVVLTLPQSRISGGNVARPDACGRLRRVVRSFALLAHISGGNRSQHANADLYVRRVLVLAHVVVVRGHRADRHSTKELV